MKLQNLETPALIVDINKLQKNIKAMQELLENSDVKLRPHYKSHKCAAIAHLQMDNGAKGMTCAKLSEAIDLADCGIEDILIANQITDIRKIRRLTDLAGNCKLTVCVDNIENIKELSKAAVCSGNTVYCLVEYEIGMMRCGVTDKETVLELAKEISNSDNLIFEGIQAYAGQISHTVNFDERHNLTMDNYEKLKELIEYLNKNDIPVNIVSGGSTGTAQIKAKNGLYNELQAGSYLFMDSTYKELDLPFDNSLFVLSTVVSSREGLTVIDAGVKTCGVDQGMPEIFDNSAELIVASEEHFQLHGVSKSLKINDKVKLIPGHCCSTINLHDKIYLVDGENVINRIEITGKGIGR